MGNWNFADVWETVASSAPNRAAVVQGRDSVTWAELDRRADRLAAWILEQGVSKQDRVAQYLHNGSPYIESLFAIMKAGLVPVNTNYRYVGDELVHLWNDSGAVGVIYDATFAPIVAAVRDRVPGVRWWLSVPDEYDEIVAGDGSGPNASVRAPWGRSGDDIYMLYTGGTTGKPKGVLWRQDDWFGAINATSPHPLGDDVDLDLVATVATDPGPVVLPACPLMHGTGAGAAMAALAIGGSVVLLSQGSFQATELLHLIGERRVKSVVLIGDAQAKPVLDAVDADPGAWDLSSLRLIVSSGAVLSADSKARLHDMSSRIVIVDSLGSTEALGAASSVSKSGADSETGRFRPGKHTAVITEDGRRVEAGSGEIGRLAVGGRIPLGYHNDPEKTAATFIEFEGRRMAVAGDQATIAADGTIEFLGRGSATINTGGEKVFPDEVETALKRHPSVTDVVVVGVPDDRFGQAVTALVELDEPGDAFDVEEIRTAAREHIAGYKVPRNVFVVDSVGRAANGKVDLQRLRSLAISLVSGAANEV